MTGQDATPETDDTIGDCKREQLGAADDLATYQRVVVSAIEAGAGLREGLMVRLT
jgi:hypothetical protein